MCFSRRSPRIKTIWSRTLFPTQAVTGHLAGREILKGKDRPPVDPGLEMAARGQDLDCNHDSEGTTLLQHQNCSYKGIAEGKSTLPGDLSSQRPSENVNDLDNSSSDPARRQDDEDCILLQRQDSLRSPR